MRAVTGRQWGLRVMSAALLLVVGYSVGDYLTGDGWSSVVTAAVAVMGTSVGSWLSNSLTSGSTGVDAASAKQLNKSLSAGRPPDDPALAPLLLAQVAQSRERMLNRSPRARVLGTVVLVAVLASAAAFEFDQNVRVSWFYVIAAVLAPIALQVSRVRRLGQFDRLEEWATRHL